MRRRELTLWSVACPVTGNHLCGFYAGLEGRMRQAAGFLAAFSEDSATVLVAAPKVRNAILSRLSLTGRALRATIEAGRLLVADHADSVAAQLAFWEETFVRTLNRGSRPSPWMPA